MSKRVAFPLAAAAVLSAGLATSAGAADLGGPPVLRGSEVVAPVYEGDAWSGFYLGGQVGLQGIRNSGHHSDGTNGTRDSLTGTPGTGPGRQVYNMDYDYAGAAFTYGLHAGFQRLFGYALLGLEADIDGPSGGIASPWYNGNPAFSSFVAGNSYQQRLQSNWQGSIRARLGFVHQATLFYLTGGVAFGSFKACTIIDGCNGTVGHVVKYNTTRVGWTLGAGIEHRLNYNWSVRAEYRYTNFGSRNCYANDPCAVDPNASDIANRIETHSVRVGLSYLFGAAPAPAPIMARY